MIPRRRNILSSGGRIEEKNPFTDIACFIEFTISSFHDYKINSKRDKQLSEACVEAGNTRVMTFAEDCSVAVTKQNQRPTSTHVISMIAAASVMMISATTVCLRLHMNGIHAMVPRVFVSLSVKSREA